MCSLLRARARKLKLNQPSKLTSSIVKRVSTSREHCLPLQDAKPITIDPVSHMNQHGPSPRQMRLKRIHGRRLVNASSAHNLRVGVPHGVKLL
jgi:hypothetical protein